MSDSGSPINERARRGQLPKADKIKGATSTMPSVDPADRTNDADSAQVGSSPTNSTMQAPRAVSAELRRSVSSARSPVPAMTAARRAETGIPVKQT